MKRLDYISWDEYFMTIAIVSAKRSKDPNTQVGSCIVDSNNRIVSTGYNGFPIGCSDDVFPWTREGGIDSKYFYVVHAECNAILNKNNNLQGCSLYTTLFPCNECAKVIIQSGIRNVIYLCNKYNTKDFVIAAKRMFDAAGVRYYKFKPSRSSLTINFVEE